MTLSALTPMTKIEVVVANDDVAEVAELMQALGAYGFLGLVKERAHFLQHIPAAMRSLREVVGRIAGLDGLASILARLEGRE